MTKLDVYVQGKENGIKKDTYSQNQKQLNEISRAHNDEEGL